MTERESGLSVHRRLARRFTRKFGSLERLLIIVEPRSSSNEAADCPQKARMPFVKAYGSKPARRTDILGKWERLIRLASKL